MLSVSAYGKSSIKFVQQIHKFIKHDAVINVEILVPGNNFMTANTWLKENDDTRAIILLRGPLYPLHIRS